MLLSILQGKVGDMNLDKNGVHAVRFSLNLRENVVLVVFVFLEGNLEIQKPEKKLFNLFK